MSHSVLILADNHKKDIFLFLLLFVLAVISVYYFPPFLNKLFFLLLLILIWISKKDYFWFMFFIIIMSVPMTLFGDYTGTAIHRIPEYDIIGHYGLTFNELFLIVFFIKAKFKGKKDKLILLKYYNIFFVLVIFLVILSFVYGIESKSFIGYIRKLLFFTLFYSFPRLVKGKDFLFMFKIFSIFTILTFINQLLSATIGFHLADKIAGKQLVERFFEDVEFRRALDSVTSQFFTFIFGFVFYSMKKPPINKNFLIFIIFISYLSVFVTGIRGWIVIFSIVVLYYFIFLEKNRSKLVMCSIVILMMFFILIHSIHTLQFLFEDNVARLSTMKDLARGDLGAGGTLLRLTVRLPRVVEGIKQNPVLGWGFSEIYSKYDDHHVGFANQILQSGLIGAIIFVIFLTKFCLVNKNINARLKQDNPFGNSVLALNLGIISMIGIHFTSTQMFGFTLHNLIGTLVITFFLLSDLFQKSAIRSFTQSKVNLLDEK